MSHDEELMRIDARIEQLRDKLDHYRDTNDPNGIRTTQQDIEHQHRKRNDLWRRIFAEREAARHYQKRSSAWGNDADDFGNSFHDWS